MTDREDLSGRTLGEFVVRERIGSGGFGDVYRCEQPLLGRQAVIKVLHQRLRYNDVVLQRFLREAQLASRLDHPYAAHVYAFGIERDDGLFWIAMEMVQGTTLARWLRERGPLPLDQLVPFFELVAEVVQTAHDRGIVHRDLKPSNVMVIERAGRLLPKLLDFGIAKLLDEAAVAEPLAASPALLDAAALSLARTRPSSSSADAASASPEPSPRSSESPSHTDGPTPPSARSSVSAETPSRSLTRTATSSSVLRDERRPITRVGVPLGSPPYMSPEQWNDAVTVGPSADLYALGVMAFEALTGRRPFDAATVTGYVELHRHAAVPSLGIGFPPALDRLFRRALAKHPDDRWASALELAAAFRTASGLATTAADLPRLDDTLSDTWLASAPQPLAESIAVLDGARNAHQARDAIHDLTRGLVRYLLAIAFATRAHVRDESSDPDLVDLVRTLPKRELTDYDRVRLLRLLVRPLAGRRGAHPVPELVDLVTPNSDDGADGLDGVLALLAATSHAGTSHAGTDDAVRDRLARVLPDLAHILHRTAFLLDYLLVVPRDQTPERWTGLRRSQRAVAPVSKSATDPSPFALEPRPAPIDHRMLLDHHPTLLDCDGRACVDLWPLAQVQSPSEGADPELFLFEGRGRNGALLIAAPAGFERSDPSVWDWLAAHVIPDVETATELGPDDRAPYLGLSPFSTSDAARFVGREREVDAMLNRLRQRPLQIVVGASGAGKSSFIHAGVLAALPPTYRVLTLRPGATPIAALQARLADLRTDAPTVVVIDQLEELFTLCASADERTHFAATLVQLIAPTEPSVRIICTIRDDFLMQLEGLAPLRPLLSPALVLLGTPSRDTLVRILIEPARRAGYTFADPALAHDIVSAVPDRPGALALLSFTASRLWELRDRRFHQLTRSAYEAMGGVVGALGQHAEAIFEELTPPEKRTVRDIFRYLITSDGTRALMNVQELRSHIVAPRAEAVLNKLMSARLLSTGDNDGESTIEIIHEALIAAWPRLQQWMRDDAEGARMREQVRRAAHRWRDNGRARGLLWRDDQFADLERWLRRTSHSGLGEIEAAFVDACRGRAKRKRRWSFALAAIAVSIAIAGFQLRALQNRVARRLAEARVTQSYAEQGRHALHDGKYTEALIYLAAADRRGDDSPVAAFVRARAAQPFLAERARLLANKGRMWSASFSRDGQHIITTDDQGGRLWDAKSYQLVAVLPHNAAVRNSVFTPDGTKVATTGFDGVVKLWSVSDGSLVTALTHGEPSHVRYECLAVSADGVWIAASDESGDRTHVWNATSGQDVAELQVSRAWRCSVAFSQDSRWLALGGGDNAVVVDTQTWKPVFVLPASQMRTLSFDPIGPRLATGSALGDVSIWSIPDGVRIRHLQDAGVGINHIAFSPDGAFVASGHTDGSERVWDVQSGALQLDLMNHHANVRCVEFDPASRRTITCGGDGSVVISDVKSGIATSFLQGPREHIHAAHFDSSGERLVGVSWDGTAWIWDASSPYHRWGSSQIFNNCLTDPNVDFDQRFIVVDCHSTGAHVWDTKRDQRLAIVPSPVSSGKDVVRAFPAISAEGDRVAIGLENIVAVYALPGGRLVRTITHPAPIGAIAFAPTGRDLVSGSADGTLLYAPDASDSVQLPTLGSSVGALAITTDHRVVVNGDHGELRVYDLERNIVLASLESSMRVAAFRFSADGRRMLAIPRFSETGVGAALWSLDHYLLIAPLESSIGNVFTARFVRGDREILAASTDGSLRLWDAMTGRLRQRYFGSDQYSFDAMFAPDGATIVAAGSDGILRFWDAASATLTWSLRAHRGGITGIHFDGDNVITRGAAGELSRWDFSKLPSRQTVDRIVHCLPLRFDDETGRVVEQEPCSAR